VGRALVTAFAPSKIVALYNRLRRGVSDDSVGISIYVMTTGKLMPQQRKPSTSAIPADYDKMCDILKTEFEVAFYRLLGLLVDRGGVAV
jgi:hypothetical protein